jgi:hypothetical protein
MTTLYNLRHDGDQYRVTKFNDAEVESSYLTTHTECDCPAGHRSTCRHRQMLPQMLERHLADSDLFWNHDAGGFSCDINGNAQRTTIACAPAEQDTVAVSEGLHDTAEGLPPGVQMISLDGDPATLWDAIADAVGEPRSPVRTTLPPAKWRRL